jgi:hypothetical protein
MSRTLRASRYLRQGNASLARFITDNLWDLDLDETLDYYKWLGANRNTRDADRALLACNDRFYLLTQLCGRKDAIHPWVFARCREVETEPDGFLDLWARGHYKSSLITFAGVLQEALVDPEITVGIFSFNKDSATKFLRQLKDEIEQNETLRRIFKDVLWERPKVDSPKWSEADGLTFRRKGNPKESTISAWGLIDAMPTGSHFRLMVYDDVIEQKHVTNEEMVKKATDRWELSNNLGVGEKTRRWHIGTRYTFADTYGVLLERKILKARVYPATSNGLLTGKPVLFSEDHWAHVKINQRSTCPAQMLQNPVAGSEATFNVAWFRPYELIPSAMNVYIMGDPAAGPSAKHDRTAIAVIGIDPQNNKYLLDGVRHRMKQSERWKWLRRLYVKWREFPGVQTLRVGWERYGLQSDLEYFEEKMREEKDEKRRFVIDEIAWPREGEHSKNARIGRLQPDMEGSKFYLSWYVFHETHGECSWKIEPQSNVPIVFNPARVENAPKRENAPVDGMWLTKKQRAAITVGKPWQVPEAIKRVDEQGAIYDVTRCAFEEMRFHPFGTKDDFIDAMSRLYDMEPSPAVQLDQVNPEFPSYPDA